MLCRLIAPWNISRLGELSSVDVAGNNHCSEEKDKKKIIKKEGNRKRGGGKMRWGHGGVCVFSSGIHTEREVEATVQIHVVDTGREEHGKPS